MLDFSTCEHITEAVMLPLIPQIAKYRNNGIDFRYIPPLNENLSRLFHNANWAHHLDPSGNNTSNYEGGHVPALCFGDHESNDAFEIFNRVINMILRQLNTDRQALKAVEWSLWEIMDNVTDHANSQVGGFIQATAYERRNSVEFVIADAGIGIPESMGMKDRRKDHPKALRDAISEGVTRDPEKNAGNGLYGSYRVSVLSGGSFEIHSLYGFLGSDKNRVNSNYEKVPYAGTSVLCSINLSDPDLLHNALQFKGKPHDPPSDYIEKQFETAEDELLFCMKTEAGKDFGSRQGGIRVRNMIENLLRDRDSIILDFADVGVISSSFADEVFGRLFMQMGPRAFMSRITMRNVDTTVNGLIDRAIVQRTKLDNGNST